MKKLILAIGIVVIIAGYALWQHHESENQPVVLPPTPTPSSASASLSATPSAAPTTGSSASMYKDGTYTGTTADAIYGQVQVQVVVTGGKITDVKWLQYPNAGGHTSQVSSMVMPVLTQEVITKQSGQVDAISGATQTTGAFVQSLQSALQQAQG